MVTQKDVAELADVSTTTVSHVVNETRFVSEELRTRVRRAMEELDYRPNAIARSLRRQRTHKIAVIVPDIAYPFLAEVARGVEDAGFRLGHNVIFCASHGDREKEDACLDLARTKQVDGIVILGAVSGIERIRELVDRGIPTVTCSRRLRPTEVDTVVADNEQAGYEATKYLLGLGHHRIGCIAGPTELRISSERLTGYRRALKELRIPVREGLIRHDAFGNRGGFDAMNELLDAAEGPTAVFACNDLMAMGAICASSKRKLRVPQDVAIVGCDDIALAAYTNPSLTTVALPKHDLGAIAVEMLVARIKDQDRAFETRVLPVRLVIRDSC